MQKYKFAFITNTRTNHDLEPTYKRHPLWIRDNFVKPDVYDWKSFGYINPSGNQINGRMIVIGSNSREIVGSGRSKAISQNWQAINYIRERLEVPVIGFGASTKTLINPSELPGDAIFTNGDTLTAAVALEELKEAANKCGLNLSTKKTKILIVGAYGIIGGAMAKSLGELNCSLFLAGKDIAKLEALNKLIGGRAKIFTNLNDINEKLDIIVTVTNHPGALLTEELIKKLGPNLLILDPAQPPNLSFDVCGKFTNKLIRVDGAIMTHPTMKYENGESEIIGLGPKEFPACVAETMIIATALNDSEERAKIEQINFMKVSLENMPLLLSLAAKYGFARTPFACYKKPITEEDFNVFKQNKAVIRTEQ